MGLFCGTGQNAAGIFSDKGTTGANDRNIGEKRAEAWEEKKEQIKVSAGAPALDKEGPRAAPYGDFSKLPARRC